MELNSSQVENIVRKVLSEMNGSHECSCGGNCAHKNADVPKTAKVAMLTDKRKIEVKEFPVPAVGDNDILVKVEGCGVCGTDVHEWKGDPFGLIPVVLGHEGTGEVIALGKNVHCDTAGKPLKVGDKIVTSVISCGECGICRLHPGNTNLCDNQGVFGLIGHNEKNPLNGWFSTHLLISAKGATYFQVNDLNLKERAAGINHIIAVDGSEKRLEMAQKLGVKTVINFREADTLEKRVALVKDVTNDMGVDFAFQCTGAPPAAADIYSYIRRCGGLCEMGFFVNNGECSINPHFALCNKEINLVGSWDYSAEDYPTTMAFLRQAREMKIPIEELVTHTFPLDKLNEAMEVNIAQQGIKVCYIAE